MNSPIQPTLEDMLDEVASGDARPTTRSTLENGGIATISAVSAYLERAELPIEVVERIEDVVKKVVTQILDDGASLATVRDIALAQERMGFFLKRKSYAIKASSPLGYSVFLQQAGEGFSFQRHIEHKVEIFHILSASSDSYAFVCNYEDWKQNYGEDRFRRWLGGAGDPFFERHRYALRPGDVLVIDRLNVVHTVIGCLLEEFATISTDLVDRLFDQNKGKPIPTDFTHQKMRTVLSNLPEVEPKRVFEITSSGLACRDVVPSLHAWGETRDVSISRLAARHLLVRPGARTDSMQDPENSSSLFVRAGMGTLELQTAASGDSLRLDLKPGSLFLLPRKICWALRAADGSPLRVSEQTVSLRTALAPTLGAG